MNGRFLLLCVDGFRGLLWKRKNKMLLVCILLYGAHFWGSVWMRALPVYNLSIGIWQQARVCPFAIQEIVHLITQLSVLYKHMIDPCDEYTRKILRKMSVGGKVCARMHADLCFKESDFLLQFFDGTIPLLNHHSWVLQLYEGNLECDCFINRYKIRCHWSWCEYVPVQSYVWVSSAGSWAYHQGGASSP